MNVTDSNHHLSRADIEKLVEWDQRYLDSDMTIEEVRERHTQTSTRSSQFIYLRLPADNTLYGYVEFERIEGDDDADAAATVKIEWLVAPGRGRMGINDFFSYIVVDRMATKILLSVSIDAHEHEKAAIYRLNLYYEVGFTVEAIEWAKDRKTQRVTLSMSRTTANGL